MSGKGSAPRPLPNYEQYSSNWDNIFKGGRMKEKELKTSEYMRDSEIIASLEREIEVMTARMERLEDEARTANELAHRLNLQLINLQNAKEDDLK